MQREHQEKCGISIRIVKFGVNNDFKTEKEKELSSAPFFILI
jgi:hypothetical protein